MAARYLPQPLRGWEYFGLPRYKMVSERLLTSFRVPITAVVVSLIFFIYRKNIKNNIIYKSKHNLKKINEAVMIHLQTI